MKQLEKLIEVVKDLANPKGLEIDGVTAEGIKAEILAEDEEAASKKKGKKAE